MRYIEFQIVIGDSPDRMIFKDIKELAHPEVYDSISHEDEREEIKANEEYKDSLWEEGVIHHLSKETYVWTFTLVYREGNFDIIKWKTAFAWKEKKTEVEKLVMDKALFIGADAGVFFIKIDDDIFDNFSKLADMMDVFIEKTKAQAPFLVYGVLEDKQSIAKLKADKELIGHLADVKKWTVQHGGEFRLENLKELKMNLSFLINDYCHYILSNLKSKYKYTDVKLGELHYIDYEDISALSEIEEALDEQVKAGQTTDGLLYEMIIEYLQRPEFKEEPMPEIPTPTGPVEEVVEGEEGEVVAPRTKIKQILKEIRLGIRRQCPKCFNNDRNKLFEVVDRDYIIMQNPLIYGFKYRCGMCGHQWRLRQGKIEHLSE
ncbi:MAG: hypothetical protein ACTSR8_03045 [Promethearchaeota archaeon]